MANIYIVLLLHADDINIRQLYGNFLNYFPFLFVVSLQTFFFCQLNALTLH
jgi:hypothetical protein